MIKYAVLCKKGHTFDGWFASSAAFDTQSKRGLVSCPECGSTKVTKALMAPNVSASTRRKGKAKGSDVAPAPAPATDLERQSYGARVPGELMDLMRRVRDEVKKNAEYVGPKFAEEARKIHDEEAPARGIYGEATAEEVKSLHDDGVPCLPLPVLPEDRN